MTNSLVTDLQSALTPQVILVKVDEADRILDVRYATPDFLLANLAGNHLQQGDPTCKRNDGRYPWLLG